MAGLHLRNMSASFCESKTLATGDAGSGGARASTMIGITGSIYLTTGSGNRNAATPGGSRSGCGYMVLPGVMGVATPMSGNLSIFAQGYNATDTHLWVKDSAGNTTDLSAGSAIDGSGTATELTYWSDTNTIGGVTNFLTDGDNITKFNAVVPAGAPGADFSVVTAFDSADCILLHADAGTDQTIKVVNDAGTTDGAYGVGALDFEATAGGISLLWNNAKDLWMEGGRAVVTANEDAADAIKLHADAGSSQTITLLNDAGTAVSDSAAAIQLTSTLGAITLSSGLANAAALRLKNTAGAGGIDIDAGTGGLTLDSTGVVSIDGADDMNFTLTSSTGGEDLTIAQVGANDSSIIITAAGTGADAVSIDATAGSMVIAASLANEKTLTIGPSSATQMVFTPHGTAASEKISLTNTSGTADDAISIVSTAGGVTVQAGNDSLFLNADGTDADALDIDSAGGIDIDAAAAIDILAGSTFSIDGTGASNVTATTGGLTLSSVTAGDVTVTSAANVVINATTGFTVDGTTVSIDGTDDSNLTVTGADKDLNIVVTGGGAQTLIASCAGTGNNAIQLNSSAGGIVLTVADEKNLTMGNGNDAYFQVFASATAGLEDVRVVNAAGTDEAAIALTAGAGGVDIDAAATKDVNVAGGQVALVSKDDAASAISLTANVGTSETIVVTNTKGTDEAAIALTATAGGVDVDAAAAKNLNLAGGQVQLVSKDDAASAISLTANIGSSETIVVTNTQGTNATAAISLAADAGGITLDAALAIVLDSDNGTIVMKDAGTAVLTFGLASGTGNVIYPEVDNAISLGNANKRFANIYTGDLHLANDRGNYTMVEEEDMLTIRNNRTGKWFKLMMEEIDPSGRDEGMQGAAPVLADSPDWEV